MNRHNYQGGDNNNMADMDDFMDFSFLLEEEEEEEEERSGQNLNQKSVEKRSVEKKKKKKKRKYDKVKAQRTRQRNLELRQNGKPVPPSYVRKCPDRPYRQTGKYRGARVCKGGKIRVYKKPSLVHLNRVKSKFMTEQGDPQTFRISKKKKVSK